MSGVGIDLRVVAGDVSDDLVLHPCWRRSATAAPVVGSWQAASDSSDDVLGAVVLDAGAEAGLKFVRGGHGCDVRGLVRFCKA